MHRTRKRNLRSNKNIQLFNVSLDVRTIVNPTWGSGVEPDDFIVDIEGDIMAYPDPDVDDTKVGTVRAYVVHFSEAQEAGCEWFEVLDTASEDIAKYMPLIDTEQSCFTDWIDSTFEVHAHQLLILDRIRIEPEFRGRGYGLYAAHLVINAFGATGGVAACLPAPYELLKAIEERERRSGQEETGPIAGWNAAQARLREHWSLLGFSQVPDSDVFALSLSLKRPSINEAIGSYFDSKMERQNLSRRLM